MQACYLGDGMKGQFALRTCTCTREVQHNLVFANICVHVTAHKAAHEYACHRDDTAEQTSATALRCTGTVNGGLWCLVPTWHAWLQKRGVYTLTGASLSSK